MNVIRFPNAYPGVQRYRVSGNPTAPDWAAAVRPGQTAWCEMTVRDGMVVSCHGEVWPSAWPELFEAVPPSVQFGSGGLKVTPAGVVALATAKQCHFLAHHGGSMDRLCPACWRCEDCGKADRTVQERGTVVRCDECNLAALAAPACAPDGAWCRPCQVHHYHCDECGVDCTAGSPGGPAITAPGVTRCRRCEETREAKAVALSDATPELLDLVRAYVAACLCSGDAPCKLCRTAGELFDRLGQP